MVEEKFWKQEARNLFRGGLNPPVGVLGNLLADHRTELVICHPTFKNADNIGRQLGDGIRGATRNFPGQRVAFVVSDGTYTSEHPDSSTIEAALQGAAEALSELGHDNVLVAVTPYEGYMGDVTPGKGSALKLVFEELAFCRAGLLILMDGDLKNDMAQWQRVFKRVADAHFERFPTRELFVTPRYVRHFVDASLTRFVVGPLTTLMGTFVPGGIAGDICLSAGAVALERGVWSTSRRKYGTDISTTFDNLGHPDTMLYEVFLGAKLHDVTDESKLSVMPGEVIGAALERIVHHRNQVMETLRSEKRLKRPFIIGSEETGIGFINPGYTDAFRVREKANSLVRRWSEFRPGVTLLLGEREAAQIDEAVGVLKRSADECRGRLKFLDYTYERWLDAMYRAVATVIRDGIGDTVKNALNYLYTAAFLEFCVARLADLGLYTFEEVLRVQDRLGVPDETAREFYEKKVDGEAFRLAERFYDGRKRILDLVDNM